MPISAALDLLPELNAFHAVVQDDVWAAAVEVFGTRTGGNAEADIRVVPAGALHAEYLAHLRVSADRGTHHAGLAQMVASLGAMDSEAEIRLRNVRGEAGRVILLTDAADHPLGLVALRPAGV